jgi:hypothetical protein
LTIAASLALLGYLLLLGAALVPRSWMAAVLSAPGRSRVGAWSLILFSILTAGLLANYGLLLVLGHLAWVPVAAIALAIIRLSFDALRRARGSAPPWVTRAAAGPLENPGTAGGVVAIFLYGALVIWTMALPIVEWDPKSIWFFHAKIIYFAGGLFRDGGWTLPMLSFSQPDYPKLLPGLAAQVAWAVSYWNEYVPKLSLLALQAAAITALLAMSGTRLVALLLLAGIVVFNATSLTPGYVDAFLAVNACCATVMLTRVVSDDRGDLLLPGLLACAMLPALKNEGILLALIIIAVTCGLALGVRDRAWWRAMAPRALITAVIVFFPPVLWMLMRSLWQIHALENFGPEFWARVQGRSGADIASILAELAKQGKMLSSAVIIGIAALILRRRLPAPTLACIAVGTLYFLGLSLVYTGTSAPLAWHLDTSASRTALSIQAILYAGMAMAIDAVLRNANGELR